MQITCSRPYYSSRASSDVLALTGSHSADRLLGQDGSWEKALHPLLSGKPRTAITQRGRMNGFRRNCLWLQDAGRVRGGRTEGGHPLGSICRNPGMDGKAASGPGGCRHSREEVDFGGLAGRGVTGLSDQSWGLNKREDSFLFWMLVDDLNSIFTEVVSVIHCS